MMASSSENPTELLENLHLRLVMSETDAQLQRFTNNHLEQIISLAASHPECVKQVTEILTYYNRRLRSTESIRLPIPSLLGLLGGGAYQTNLSMVYLKIGTCRLSEKDAVDLLPVLMQYLSLKLDERTACDDIILLSVPCFIALSHLPKEKWPEMGCMERIESTLARYFSILLAADFGNAPLPVIIEHVADSSKPSQLPGLSSQDVNFLAKKILQTHPALGELKHAIVRLLDYDFLTAKGAFPVLQIGTTVNINEVSDAASLALKKVDIQECVDDKVVVEKLMALYLGTASEQKKYPPTQQIPPSSAAIQAKILPLLTRSSIASSLYMNNIKICLDVLANTSHSKKTQSGFEFVIAVVEKMPTAALNAFGTTFFNKIVGIIEDGSCPTAGCAALAYRCLAALGKANPQLVLSRMALVEELFNCIPQNAEDVSYAVMDCLSSWHDAFATANDETVMVKLKNIVKTNIGHDNNRSRMAAIKYADALLRTGDMDVRWLLIKAAGDKRDDVRREAIRLLEMSFKLPTPPVEEIVDYIWKQHQNPEQQLTPEMFEMSTKFIWAACSVTTGDTHQLFHLEDDEHFFITAPLVAKLLSNMPTEKLENITRMALHATTSSQDLYLLRITACFNTVFPVTDMTTCPAACVQLTKGSTRFEMLETASFLSVTSNTAAENDKLFAKYLSDLETNPLPGFCWLTASTAVFGGFELAEEVQEKLLTLLLKIINDGYDRPSSTLESAIGALGVILKKNENTIAKEMVFAFLETCEKIASSRKDSITLRARSAAVMAMGLFDGSKEKEVLEKMITSLFAVGEGPPQSALQLTVGEALWTACLGPAAPIRRNVYTVSEASIKLSSLSNESAERTWCEANIERVLETIVEEKYISKNHHLRRAAVVWLMVFVQKANYAESSSIKPKIEKIQATFADALTENDDFTQDIASKGMGMVYQMASEAEKKLLIADLMASLSEGRTSTQKVQGDTVVFQENQLGKAPDGSNLTTYKELCNLATDLNQPDLLYKFMQLAKHNATWNAKKGAAFGFGEILEQARDELQPYFGQLAPKLFRYRYDPDLKVQQSMKSIWSILTAGKRNVVEEYADAIAKELFTLLTDKEWRVRESSCLALADLLHSNDTPYIHSKVPELFETIMRVSDDIKESVRLAAQRTAKSLQKLIVRLATSSNRQKSEAFLNVVIPVFIEKGVNSTVQATRMYTLVLLMELAETSGRHLQPFLHVIIPCLLDAISENESSLLNYLAARSSAAQLEALDDARTQMASTSPMMTAINDVLPHVNSSALQQMHVRLCEQLRTSVGVSTRAAAAQFITQLTLRAPQLLLDNRACCDKFFASLVPGVSDRNPTVRKNSANALSYLARFCSAGPVDKLVAAMNKNLVSDSDEMKRASLHVLKNFSAHCSDIIQGHGAALVPYVFLETCREVVKGDEASKRRHEEWNELWEELVPSTSSALALYRKEVIAVAVDVLQNNAVWVVKAQAGRMLARVAECLGTNLSATEADSILSSVIPLLNGRTWDGKEKILMAVTSIIKASGEQLGTVWSAEKQKEVATILKREAGRKKKDYVAHGLAACAAFAEHLGSVEMAAWVQEKVAAVVAKALGQGGNDSESEEEGLSNLEKEAAAAKFLSINLVAMANSLAAYRDGPSAAEPVATLASYLQNANLYWKARQDVLGELQGVVERWKLTTALPSDTMVQSLLTVAEEMCDQQRRSVAAQALQIIMKMAERRETFATSWEAISEAVRTSRASTETGLADRLENAMETD